MSKTKQKNFVYSHFNKRNGNGTSPIQMENISNSLSRRRMIDEIHKTRNFTKKKCQITTVWS